MDTISSVAAYAVANTQERIGTEVGIRVMKMAQDEDGSRVLMIKLPFVLDQKVELYTRKDDLTLQVGAFKKSITLPHSMAGKKVLEANLEEGWLKVRFEGEELGKGKAGRRGRGRKAPRKAS